jgi:penicillin-binding protein 1A
METPREKPKDELTEKPANQATPGTVRQTLGKVVSGPKLRRLWGRKLVKISASLMFVFLLVGGFLWARCGIAGCPDVDKLKGYMPDQASVLLDYQEKEIGKLFVERRSVVPYDSMPKHVGDAFVAMEDRRFWKHNGVDWQRVFGAAWKNVKELGIEEGSSTITMQLARNVFPDKLPAREKTPWRKIGEARVAREIEQAYEKKEILQLYLNQINFGHGAYGIEAAAQEYFGKPASKLTLSESAILAAIPRAPSRLNPRSNRQLALEGRKVVLDRMVKQELISDSEAAAAKKEKLRLKRGHIRTGDRAPYFVEAVRRTLEEQLGDAIYTEGYTIHTTLDVEAQQVAEEELRKQMQAIESGAFGRYRHTTYAVAIADTTYEQEGSSYLQAALVMMDPRTGDVRVLIGGRDYEDSQFNRATQAIRQPGSAFKPFVYSAALAAGYPPTHRLMDQPIRLALDRRNVWEPKNYDGSYSGAITMRDALVYSKNVATVRLAMDVGIDRVVETAHQIGLEGRIPSVPSVVLGSAEVTPIALTTAYSTFATQGVHPEPRLITRVVDRKGNVVWSQEAITRNALDPAVAFVVTDMMKDVVNRGTGAAVRAVGFSGVAAGKTGTTNDAADVWFVGFTPRIVGTVWIGFDKRKTVLRGATGGELAAPIWGRIMRRVAEQTGDWLMPQGVEMRQVDEFGNALAENCPIQGAVRQEYFIAGTAPFAQCYISPYPYDSLGMGYDTMATYDEGWWARLKKRVFGADTIPTLAVDTMADPVNADSFRLRTDTFRRFTPDSLRRPSSDTLRRPRPDTLLGRPATDTTRRPRPDTVRRDTTRRDTLVKNLTRA